MEAAFGALRRLVEGSRILVTASSRGIGFYAALGLARLGARVAIMARGRGGLEEAAARIEEETGWRPPALRGDLRSGRDVERCLREAWESLGGLDAVVFNAGNVGCEPCFLDEAGLRDWVEAALLHLVAPGYLSSVFVREKLRRGEPGVLVFLSSVSVREPMPGLVLADTARAGLQQLARSIARRYGGRGLRAYTVLLGSFDTPGARRTIERVAERKGMEPGEAWRRLVLGATPLARTGRPEELAGLIAYLVSPLAEYMNGSTLLLDGAMTRCA